MADGITEDQNSNIVFQFSIKTIFGDKIALIGALQKNKLDRHLV